MIDPGGPLIAARPRRRRDIWVFPKELLNADHRGQGPVTGGRKFSSGKFSLPSFWTSAIPFAALPNIPDIVGAAIADIAISIRGLFAGASHVSEIDGMPRSVIHRSWDRVDAGIGTGHKTLCFGYACAAMVGCLGSAFASWSEA
jgi:hypothetical protein